MGLGTKSEAKVIINFKYETFTCTINKDVLGSTLLSYVCTRLGTYEPWWFGLQYIDSHDIEMWLDPEKKLNSHDIPKENKQWIMKFNVKHYPENLKNDVIQTRTLEIFYEVIRDKIMSEEIAADAGVVTLLGGLHMQYIYGDIAGTKAGRKIIHDSLTSLVPAGLRERYDMEDSAWLDLIEEYWLNSNTLTKAEALREAAAALQSLEMYGVDYYEIKNVKETPLLLGITKTGINIYKIDNKLKPRVTIPWTEMRSLEYKNKKMVIRQKDKKADDFVMYLEHNKKNVHVMDLCIERYSMFKDVEKIESAENLAWRTKALNDEKVVEKQYETIKQDNEVKKKYTKTLRRVQRAKIDNNVDEKLDIKLNEAYEEALELMNKKIQKVEEENRELNEQRIKAEKHLESMMIVKDVAVKAITNEKAQKEAFAEEHAKAVLLAKLKEDEAIRLKRELEAFKSKYQEDQENLRQITKDLEAGRPIAPSRNIPEPLIRRTASVMQRKVDQYQGSSNKRTNSNKRIKQGTYVVNRQDQKSGGESSDSSLDLMGGSSYDDYEYDDSEYEDDDDEKDNFVFEL